ncbi:transmembrane protein 209 [Maniola jurtina]|uniref:transmembrane protein 209 n=1 Tax=Maniola jurtina TaxID=191418 RepID=UPI001E68FD6C|nr:transmembrane protein 209 [Maniola jurtina]
MSLSPNSRLVQRTIELNYTNKKRSTSFKWIVVNAVFLLVFVYDLSCKCPGYTSVLHYVELGCAVVLAANLLQYAVRLAPSRAPRLPLSPEQQKLLGLSSTDLDSSFILTEHNGSGRSDSGAATATEELSLWPARSPPRTPPRSPPSPPRAPCEPSPTSRRASSSPTLSPAATFADDADSLAEYLARCASSGGPAPLYQLSAVDTGGGKLEESSPQGSPDTWWRLDLDPQRLTQYNLNLRLWIHITILQRLLRELRAADEALARAALCEAGALRGGRVPVARLRALAAHVPALAALAPFLEPFPDQRYALRRIAELADGGCLSAYRWDSGGADWEPSQPPDAELLLRLVAAYLDGQLPRGARARPFSDEYLVEGATPNKQLAIARLRARPPHFALVWRGATLGVARGRNNLLHTLLLFLAAAARADPPALARTHLGRAGLNMLWIIGR